MKINLNQSATVVLTKTGADALNKENEYYNNLLKRAEYHSKTDYKAGDAYTAQIWSLFETFGLHTKIGFEVFCVGCEMDVKEWK